MVRYLPSFLKFLDSSIFRLEPALVKIIQVMKRNVHFSIFILLKCAFYQLPWKHCVTRFLDSLTPLRVPVVERWWAHYNLDPSPGKAVLRESGGQPPMRDWGLSLYGACILELPGQLSPQPRTMSLCPQLYPVSRFLCAPSLLSKAET